MEQFFCGKSFNLGEDSTDVKVKQQLLDMARKGEFKWANVFTHVPSKLRVLLEIVDILVTVIIIATTLNTNIQGNVIGSLSLLLLVNQLSDYEEILYAYYIRKSDGYYIYDDQRPENINSAEVNTCLPKFCIPTGYSMLVFDKRERQKLVSNYYTDLVLCGLLIFFSLFDSNCFETTGLDRITCNQTADPDCDRCLSIDVTSVALSSIELLIAIYKYGMVVDRDSCWICIISFCGLNAFFGNLIWSVLILPFHLPAQLVRIAVVTYYTFKYSPWHPCDGTDAAGPAIDLLPT